MPVSAPAAVDRDLDFDTVDGESGVKIATQFTMRPLSRRRMILPRKGVVDLQKRVTVQPAPRRTVFRIVPKIS